MRHAIQVRKTQERRAEAIDAILKLRSQVAAIADEEIWEASEMGSILSRDEFAVGCVQSKGKQLEC